MKPNVDLVLQKLMQALMGQIGPAIRDEYAQRSALVAGLVLQCAAEEWDRAAARRVEENAALRDLFRAADPIVADAALRERLSEAAASEDGGLRIAQLDTANDALRALLIELHAHVETLEGAPARELEAAIWEELRASTERRGLSLAPF